MCLRKRGTSLVLAALVMGGCSPGHSSSPSSSSSQPEQSDEYVPPIARESREANLQLCAVSSTIAGIDVSPWNMNIQWPRVQIAGNDFTFVKATEGDNYVSPVFTSDFAAAKKSKMVRGAYHFFRPGDDPEKQAELFLQTAGPLLESTDLPPLLDWEITDGVSTSLQIERAKKWFAIVEKATGKIPILYTAPSFWNSLGNPQDFIRYSLFIANYEVTCPYIPPPWSRWTFWQHSSEGQIDGIMGDADVDLFNGSLEQLRAFAIRGY